MMMEEAAHGPCMGGAEVDRMAIAYKDGNVQVVVHSV